MQIESCEDIYCIFICPLTLSSLWACLLNICTIRYDTIRYDTIEEFNVDWKAECSQLNLAHVTALAR